MTSNSLATWLVLGATGRLGRSLIAEVAQRIPRERLQAAARHAPQPGTLPGLFVQADAGDARALQPLLASARVVLHCCGLDQAKAQALTTAAAAVDRWPTLVVASSIAARRPADWTLAEDTPTPDPDDEFGRGLSLGNRWLTAHWQGPLHIALLPQLVATGEPRDRLAQWLQRARQGQASIAGTGRQRPALLVATDAARLLADLGERSDSTGTTQLANPRQESALDLAKALLEGAGLAEVPLKTGSDDRALSGGDERLNLGKMLALWPNYPWPSLLDQLRAAAATWPIF